MLLCSPELCARREVVGSPAVKKETACGSGWGRSDPDFLVSEDSCVKWWKFLSSLGAFLIHNKAVQAYGSVPPHGIKPLVLSQSLAFILGKPEDFDPLLPPTQWGRVSGYFVLSPLKNFSTTWDKTKPSVCFEFGNLWIIVQIIKNQKRFRDTGFHRADFNPSPSGGSLFTLPPWSSSFRCKVYLKKTQIQFNSN